jgi:cell division protein FtsA
LNRYNLAIDIGSTKISAVITELRDDHDVGIIGAGVVKSQGLKKGAVVNIELASKSIKLAVDEARRVAGTSPNVATVSLSGAYIKTATSHGLISLPNNEVSDKDIKRVIDSASFNSKSNSDEEQIHVLPYRFSLDDQQDIDNPMGMNGTRLEVDVFIISALSSSVNNLTKALYQAGIKVENFVLNSYASAIATLNEDERNHGVCLIDMGGSTSNMIIQDSNAIRYVDFLPVGSSNITKDLSKVLRTQPQFAERVKKDFGAFIPDNEGVNDTIEIPKIGDEQNMQLVEVELIKEIIFARVEDTLLRLKEMLDQSGLKDSIGAGLVLTGGFSQIDGIRELALDIFEDMPVRVGRPYELDGLFDKLKDPSYSTLVGLAIYNSKDYCTLFEIDSDKQMRYEKKRTSLAQLNNEVNIADEVSGVIEEEAQDSVGINLQDQSKKPSTWINVIKNLF